MHHLIPTSIPIGPNDRDNLGIDSPIIQPIQVIPSFGGYGADKLVLDLHQSFLQKGLCSRIISFTKGVPADIPYIDSLGLENPYNPAAVIRLSKKLKEIASKDSIGSIIIHTHLTPCQLWAPLAVRMAGMSVPMLTTEHSTNNRRRAMTFGNFFDRKLYAPYKYIVCISEGVRGVMLEWLPGIKSRLVTVLNGINTKTFMTVPLVEKEALPPVIISVGRLQKMKNYQMAVNACHMLKDLDFEYHIIGDGPERGAIKKIIEEKGLVDKVKLFGFQSNVAKYLGRSNIFLMPSFWEGFGLALVEAMACGLPVIVSNVPGVREIVGQDQQGGFLVNPNNCASIAEKLRILINSNKLCMKMGAYNRRCAINYSIERTAQEYINLYQKVLLNNAC